MSALQLFSEIMPKLNAVMDFLNGPAGGAVVAKVKELGDIWQETSADTTIVEALRLLKQMQDDGNLQRVADLSRQIGLFAETIDLESLLGQFMQQSHDSPIFNSAAGLLQSGRLMAAALADATEHESRGKTGGLSGLYHMLKDPEVQRGMRAVAVLPVYLEKAGVLPGILENKPSRRRCRSKQGHLSWTNRGAGTRVLRQSIRGVETWIQSIKRLRQAGVIRYGPPPRNPAWGQR